MSYTPGPWESDEERIHYQGQHVAVVSMPDDFPCFYGDEEKFLEECEANVRLIAAAPDLLAALVDLLPFAVRDVKRLNSLMVGGLYPSINLAKLERAREAIARAKGVS